MVKNEFYFSNFERGYIIQHRIPRKNSQIKVVKTYLGEGSFEEAKNCLKNLPSKTYKSTNVVKFDKSALMPFSKQEMKSLVSIIRDREK